jgi:hypothetical protein
MSTIGADWHPFSSEVSVKRLAFQAGCREFESRLPLHNLGARGTTGTSSWHPHRCHECQVGASGQAA